MSRYLNVCQLSSKILRTGSLRHGAMCSPILKAHNRSLQTLSTVSYPKTGSHLPVRCAQHHYSTETKAASSDNAEKHEFQAETRMLLDIVAKSLYSDKEVFIRELISNASDALEKLRYTQLSEVMPFPTDQDHGKLEIRLSTDKQNRTLTIQDSGIGMTKEELISNLGTIARSGSKAFMTQLSEKNVDVSTIIGQFGVGFYSAFMVADKVEVYTKSHKPDSVGYIWTSDGSGSYEISEFPSAERGTKIVIHLKSDCREFADDQTVLNVIRKYSNFVNSPIFVNDEQTNKIQPLWVLEPKSVKPEEHIEFYRYISNSNDQPRFVLHYRAEAPLSIKSVLYFPETKPGLFEMSRETEVGVSLYTRRVLIKSKTDNILPKWLRFVKGVVDSEDIPLNLSRELLQNSPLINKLRNVLTSRILKFLQDRSKRDTENYLLFYKDYSHFIKEGIVTTQDLNEKEEIAKLLRYESSELEEGNLTTLPEYIEKLAEGQKDIYYLCAPSRTLALSSPYLEALRTRKVPVLFCYEPHDELILLQLRSFQNFNLTSVEKEMRSMDKEEDETGKILGPDSLPTGERDELVSWIQETMKNKVHQVKITSKLDAHPCVVTIEEMGAARHFLKTQSQNLNEEQRFSLLQPRLEINPKHPIIKKLASLSKSNPALAELVVQQLFSNAMVVAGLVEDPRTILGNINQLLTLALEKH
uniref:Heat shock protein 75 kDa, mitochondrial n=1 Tax=Cacopsylla melanoneura TaxID=428564 RepID=A0A8D9BU47_9HEMI